MERGDIVIKELSAVTDIEITLDFKSFRQNNRVSRQFDMEVAHSRHRNLHYRATEHQMLYWDQYVIDEHRMIGR